MQLHNKVHREGAGILLLIENQHCQDGFYSFKAITHFCLGFLFIPACYIAKYFIHLTLSSVISFQLLNRTL